MTFDQLEVGRFYWFKPVIGLGESICGEFNDIEGPCLTNKDSLWEEHEVTDIRPVPTREEFEALVSAAKAALIRLEQLGAEDDIETLGACPVCNQLRAALAAVGVD